MNQKKTKANIFLELKESVSDYKRLLKTFSKDLILVLFILALLLAYFIILKLVMPPEPSFTQATLWSASVEDLKETTASLELFYYTFLVLSIISVILVAAAIIFTKDWVWSGFRKQRFSIKTQPKFLALTLIIYVLASLIGAVLILFSGFLMQMLSNAGASLKALQFIGILFLIIVIPFMLQIINYSSYEFTDKRKFFENFKKTFFSFSKTKNLLLPYLFILIVGTVIGFIVNFLVLIRNPVASVILSFVAILLFVLLLSWEKIYSFIVFERIYGR